MTTRSNFTADEWRAHEKPTWDNQMWHARRVWHDEGPAELKRHAEVGKTCGCKGCFCCAALMTYRAQIAQRH